MARERLGTEDMAQALVALLSQDTVLGIIARSREPKLPSRPSWREVPFPANVEIAARSAAEGAALAIMQVLIDGGTVTLTKNDLVINFGHYRQVGDVHQFDRWGVDIVRRWGKRRRGAHRDVVKTHKHKDLKILTNTLN